MAEITHDEVESEKSHAAWARGVRLSTHQLTPAEHPLMQAARSIVDVLKERQLIPAKKDPRFLAKPSELPAIEDLTQEIHRMIKELGVLPKKVEDNPYFQAFFTHNFEDEGDNGLEAFLDEYGQRALMVPKKKNERSIQDIIEEMADSLCIKLGLDKKNERTLALAIRTRFQRNLEIFEAEKILAKEDGTEVSPLDLKVAYEKVDYWVQHNKVKREEATFAILFLTGFIDQDDLKKCTRKPILRRLAKGTLRGFSPSTKTRSGAEQKLFSTLDEYDVTPICRDIEESIGWAREHIEGMVKRFNKTLGKHEASGTLTNEINTPPGLNYELASNHDSYDWVCTFYDPKTPMRDHNDAHLVTLYALIHFQEKKRLEKLDARLKKGKMEDQLVDKLFKKNEKVDVTVPTLRLDTIHSQFIVNEARTGVPQQRNLECRQLDPNNYAEGVDPNKLVVYLTDMGHKEVPSRVKKRLSKKSRHLGPNKMLDEIRVRMVFVGINSKECDDPNNESVFIETLLKAAQSQHLSLRRTDLEAKGESGELERPGLFLEPGQFIIEKDLKHERYPKINLVGKLMDGTNIEVQGLPLDTFLFDEAHNSGMDHDVKDENEMYEILQDGSPQTTSPLIHEIAKLERARIKALRDKTKDARNKFEIESLKAKIQRKEYPTTSQMERPRKEARKKFDIKSLIDRIQKMAA